MAQTEPLLNSNANEKYQRRETDSPQGMVSPVNSPRVCRDVCWIVAFAFFWMGILLVSNHAVQTGDLKRLSYGIDTNGNVCGTAKDRQQTDEALRSDTSSRSQAFLPNPEHTDLLFCVASCAGKRTFAPAPATPLPQYVCFDTVSTSAAGSSCDFKAADLRKSDAAAFNVQAAKCFAEFGYKKAIGSSSTGSDSGSGSAVAAPLVNKGYLGRCFPLYVSKPFMHFCVPEFKGNGTNTTAGAGTHAAPGMPDAATVDKFRAYFGAGSSVFGRMMSELKEATWVILSSLAIAGALSLLWIGLLPIVGPCMIWGSLAFTVCGLLAVSAFLVHSASVESADTYQYKVTMGMGIVIGVVGFVCVALACCMASRIQLALRLTEHAGKALLDVPSMLLAPFTMFTLFAFFMWGWVYVAAYLLSSGTLVLSEGTHYRSFSYDDHTKALLIYHGFALLWNAAFLLDLGKLVVSMCVSIWYWAPYPCTASGEWVEPLKRVQPDQDHLPSLHFCVFAHAISTAAQFSLGSVALGSFLAAMLGAIRMVFEYVKQKAMEKSGNNACVRCALCCMSCCLACIEGMLEFVSDNAYIQISMFGGNFCQSASAGFRLLMRNPLRMLATGLVQSVLIFAGKVFVVASSVAFATFMLSYRSSLDPSAGGGAEGYSGAAYALLPLILVAGGAWAVCSIVFNVFVVAISTMLQCVCEDEERNDGSLQHPYFLSESLQAALNSIQQQQ